MPEPSAPRILTPSAPAAMAAAAAWRTSWTAAASTPPDSSRAPGPRTTAEPAGGASVVVEAPPAPALRHRITFAILRGEQVGGGQAVLSASGGAHDALRQGAQAGDPATDHRDGRPPVQARRYRRLRRRGPHGGRGTDQRRLLRPLRVQGRPRHP